MDAEQLTIKVNDTDSLSGFLYLAPKKNRVGVTLILGHGAGAGQLTPFMRLFASGLAGRGLDVVTFNFVYMEQGRKVPDPAPKLEATYRKVIESVAANKNLKGNRVFAGGKSMGGRIASQVAAQQSADEQQISGLVFLGYPLHPPGRPEKLRDQHLPQIKAPMLFIQGSRDAFGSEDEIRATVKGLKLPATLHIVGGGDHSLKVPKSGGIPQHEIYEAAMDEIATWCREH